MNSEDQPQVAFADGPYLQTAIICENVLVEQDGVKSAIRIYDRHVRTTTGSSPPLEMEPHDMELVLLLRFKSGSARGSYPLEIRLQKPSGESLTPGSQTIMFEGEDDRGTDVVIHMTTRIELTGLYWFDVYLNNTRVTRIPLRIVYLRQVTNQNAPPSGGQPPPPALGM